MNKGRLTKSFQYAFQGIVYCVTSERNMKIHVTAAIFVIAAGLYFHISRIEWSIILLTIGVVLALELINTAVEKTVDLATKQQHPLAKLAKDAAAGAVLMFSCIAVVIGFIIFMPYLH